jgi:hypothetical protein
METLLNATDVRKDWGHFIDTVVRVGPQFIKRNRDTLVVIGADQLKELFASFRFKLDVEREENGSYSGTVNGLNNTSTTPTTLDVVANAPTIDELKLALADELVEYAQEYSEEFALYFNASNRKSHAPYVMNILLQDNQHAVANLIDA